MIRVQYDLFPASYFRTLEEAAAHVTRSHQLNPHHDLTGWSVEVVDRESRPCRFCGSEVESDQPDCDFCRGCFYAGRSQESPSDLVEKLRALPDVDADSVGIWHTGGGCFSLGAVVGGFDLLASGEEMDPTIPPSPKHPWGFVISHPEDNGYYVMDDWFADATSLVAAIPAALERARANDWDS